MMEVVMKVFAILLMCQLATSIPTATQCNSTRCTSPRGFIEYRVGNPNIQWTIAANEYTTFVVIIRNIQVTSDAPWGTLAQFSHIFSNSQVLDKESRLFTFENTRQLSLSLRNNNILQFRLEYYTGCSILKDRNITLYKKPELASQGDEQEISNAHCSSILSTAQFQYTLFLQQGGYNLPLEIQFTTWLRSLPLLTQLQLNQCYQQQISGIHVQQRDETSEPSCWFIIPTITEERQETALNIFGFPITTTVRTNIDVQETYLTVQDISTNGNTTINVFDLMTGTSVMSLQGNASLSVVNLPKNNSTHLQYQANSRQQTQLSTLLLIDLTCQHQQGCEEAGFSFSSYALRQSDLDCIERENKCRFNIGTKNFTCHNNDSFLVSLIDPMYLFEEADEDRLTSQECPAFQLFISSIDAKLNEIDPVEYEEEGRSHGRKRKIKYCKNYSKFCTTPYCSDFATRGCRKMCIFMKLNLKICDFVHNLFS